MSLTLCRDLSPADWIVSSRLPWDQLVRFGPAGFSAYARLRLLSDPAYPGQPENDVDTDWRTDQLPSLLEWLATRTGTPDDCYFCVWEGFAQDDREIDDDDARYIDDESVLSPLERYGSRPGLRRAVDSPLTTMAPKVVVPHRSYWLFSGRVTDVGGWDDAHGWPGQPRLDDAMPAFVWPADRAWCVAHDVDPHWAGIGADSSVITQLTTHSRLDVVTADPTEEQPSYR